MSPAIPRRGLQWRRVVAGVHDPREPGGRIDDTQLPRGHTGARVDVDPRPGLVELVVVVVLGDPERIRLIVDGQAGVRCLVDRAPQGVEALRAALAQSHRLQALLWRLRRRRAGAVVGTGREPRDPASDQHHREHQREDCEHPMADSEWNPPLGAGRQRPQHRGDLSGGAARARRLDRQHVLEVGDQLRVVGVPVFQSLGRGAVYHRGQRRGHLRPHSLDVGQLLANVLHGHGHLALALERHLPGQHLVQHDPERVQIRLTGHVLAERLLR